MIVAPAEFVLRSLDATWDYGRWSALPGDGHRYEVIDRVLYLTTAPSSFYGWITGRLWRFVGIPTEDAGVAFASSAPLGVLMPGCDPVQPDFLLVRQERAAIIRDGRIYGPPDLIVELLPPVNPEHDTETKRRAYARAGVPEYCIIRPATNDLLLCWQPERGAGDYAQVRVVPADGAFGSPTLPVRVALADLAAGAPDRTC